MFVSCSSTDDKCACIYTFTIRICMVSKRCNMQIIERNLVQHEFVYCFVLETFHFYENSKKLGRLFKTSLFGGLESIHEDFLAKKSKKI